MSDTTNRIQLAYDEWAEIYDTNNNPTRDMNYKAIREESFPLADKRVLEIGCGTGLNTKYLSRHAGHVTGMDISKRKNGNWFLLFAISRQPTIISDG